MPAFSSARPHRRSCPGAFRAQGLREAGTARRWKSSGCGARGGAHCTARRSPLCPQGQAPSRDWVIEGKKEPLHALREVSDKSRAVGPVGTGRCGLR